MNFEKLGAFFLGKRFDANTDAVSQDVVLYDSKDLTTHAVIIGMTGSGKTGLGIGLIEEAAIDKVPVIAIDPKGDMGNLLLTFPKMRASDLKPWVDPQAANKAGQTVDEFSADQAKLWKDGLKDWGQELSRIQKFRDSVDLEIYTPGSQSGIPVSVLDSFSPPSQAVMDDVDAYRERLQSAVSGLLALLEIDADPVNSREHVFLSNVLDHAWKAGKVMSLGKLIAAITDPPIDRVGVMDLESFYPSSERMKLALKLNNVLASPAFQAWLEGAPLDASKFLYSESGKPKISVMSIAHLSDVERMFFVTMLLNEIVSWVRSQPGTGSLRAIIYMDEIFGYLPPVANPPSKVLFLTLLKQARAHGVGLVLATQNPVDLDYKALSNTGTWMIGRLQTERDKKRVLDGLEGLQASGSQSKKHYSELIGSLGKRRFLLHNVHEKAPVVFNTRWVMSYLAGPMTRQQISKLMKDKKADHSEAVAHTAIEEDIKSAPILPKSIKQYYQSFYGSAGELAKLTYEPRVIGVANVAYSSAKYGVNESKTFIQFVSFSEGPLALDWGQSEAAPFTAEELLTEPDTQASYAECPKALSTAKMYKTWKTEYLRWLRTHRPIKLFICKDLKAQSNVDETERDFRIRLQHMAKEQRDQAVEALKEKYQDKVEKVQERLRKQEQKIEVQESQAKQKKFDTAISIGTAVLGAVFGRKMGVGTATRGGSAMKSMGRAGKEMGDVKRARETAKVLQEDIAELEAELSEAIDALDDQYDVQDMALTEAVVRATQTNMSVPLFGLLWQPVVKIER